MVAAAREERSQSAFVRRAIRDACERSEREDETLRPVTRRVR